MIPDNVPLKDLIYPPPAAADQGTVLSQIAGIAKGLHNALQEVVVEDLPAAVDPSSVLSDDNNQENDEEDEDEGVDNRQQEQQQQQQQLQNDCDKNAADADAVSTPPQTAATVKKMQLTPLIVENVMKEFAGTVANTKFYSAPADASPKTSSSSATTTTKHLHAPAALMRCRIRHHKRNYTKWKIAVDHVEFKRRVALEKNRRKYRKPRLWDATTTEPADEKGATVVALPPQATIDILAYDDVM